MRRVIIAVVSMVLAASGAVLSAPGASATPAVTNPDSVYLWKGPTGCDSSAYFTASSSGSGTHITSITGAMGDILSFHNKCGMNVTIDYQNEAIGTDVTVGAGGTLPLTIHFDETVIPFAVSGAVVNLYVTSSSSSSATVDANGKTMNAPKKSPTFAGLHSVKRSGSFVLLRGPVILASGQTASPQVSFMHANSRKLMKKAGSAHVTKSGKVIVHMTSKKPTLVTLTLSAPATDTFASYRGGRTWLVK